MIIRPKLKVYIDWNNDKNYTDETENLESATFPMFQIDMAGGIAPESKPSSGSITLVNLNGRYSLNPNIPNKDTALESALRAFPLKGVRVILTLKDNSDPDMMPYTSIFFGRLAEPTFSVGKVSFKLRDKLSADIQYKASTDVIENASIEELIMLLNARNFYVMGSMPVVVNYAWLEDESVSEAVMELTQAMLGYVVSDNSPVVNVYSYDYMLVQPFDEIDIDVSDTLETYNQFTTKMNVFDELKVAYTLYDISINSNLVRTDEMIQVSGGETNVKHEIELSSPLVDKEKAKVTYDVVTNGDLNDTTITYELFSNKIIFTATNIGLQPSFITNINVLATTISPKNENNYTVVAYGVINPIFSRSFPNNRFIQDKQHAKWIAETLKDRMERYETFGNDFIVLNNVIPNDEYVFGRPVNFTDEYGTQDKYYIFGSTASYNSKTGLWLTLFMVSKRYLFGDGTAPDCIDFYVIGVDELNNQKVCAI